MATENVKAREAILEQNEPLIAIPEERAGRVVTRYFFSEEEADRTLKTEEHQSGVTLAGSWADLDWEEAVEELDRIRHGSEPTPPITDL